MFNHTRQLIEDYRKRGEKLTADYLRDTRIPFTVGLLKDVLLAHFRSIQDQITMDTSLSYGDVCNIVPDLARRLEYNILPFDVQALVVSEAFESFKSAQTNREHGHNHGYELRDVDAKEKRMHSLSFTPQCASVVNGLVRLMPNSLENSAITEEDVERIALVVLDSFRAPFENTGEKVKKPREVDSQLRVKDKLLHFLGRRRGERGWAPVSNWGSVIPFGKKDKGKAFKITYDTTRDSWWLSIAYDSLVPQSPFFESFAIPDHLDTPLLLRKSGFKRAHQWLARRERVYSSTGNTCAIDPGIRTPLSVFDVRHRNVVKLFPDLPIMLDGISLQIASQQSRSANPGVPSTKSPKARLRRNRRGKSRRAKKKQAKKRRDKREKIKVLHAARSLGEVTRSKRNHRSFALEKGKRGLAVLYDRAYDRVRNAHGQIANELVGRFDLVILPEFMSRDMVRKRRRTLKLPAMVETENASAPNISVAGSVLHKTTRKRLLSIRHFQLRQRILAKARGDPGQAKDVLITTEEFTTKTIPSCGTLNNGVGSSPVNQCPCGCGLEFDRDGGSTFCVLLRAITKEEIVILPDMAEESDVEMG